MSYKHYDSFQDLFRDDKNISYQDFAINPLQNSKCDFTSINFDDNLFFYKSDFLFNADLKKLCESKIDGIALNYRLQGDIQYESLLSKDNHIIRNDFTNINITSKEMGYHTLKKDEVHKAINIILKKDFLDKTLENSTFKDEIFRNLENEYFFKNIKLQKTNIKAKLLTNDLYHSPFNGELDTLFIHSKLLELIYIELNDLLRQNHNIDEKSIKFDQYDRDALYKAKEILINNIQNPPTILELSKLVHLNEFKLKIGFKKLFNITPYSLLLEHKMQEAKKLLETSELSVNEVSQEVGYKQQQNFRTAFVKRFGILPKDLMKSRNYYYL